MKDARKLDARKLFAKNLAKLLDRDGYSRAGLAAYLATPRSVVSRWLGGKILPLKHLDDIAAYLNIPVSALFSVAKTHPLGSRKLTTDEAFRALASSLGYTVRKRGHLG